MFTLLVSGHYKPKAAIINPAIAIGNAPLSINTPMTVQYLRLADSVS